MLHTKFRRNVPTGSGEEDFLRFLPYMGMTAILVMRPGPFIQTFVPIFPRRLHIKFGFDWPSAFRGEEVRKWWTTTTTTTTTDAGAWVYFKLTYEPSAKVS